MCLGIGLEGHEQPYLRGGTDNVIQPGHTFSNEPGVYIEDKVRYIQEPGMIWLGSHFLLRLVCDWRIAFTSAMMGGRYISLQGWEARPYLRGRLEIDG